MMSKEVFMDCTGPANQSFAHNITAIFSRYIETLKSCCHYTSQLITYIEECLQLCRWKASREDPDQSRSSLSWVFIVCQDLFV